MYRFAVVGSDVSASLSPQMHSFIASGLNERIAYDKISVAEDEFSTRIEELLVAYDGLNITIPYKLSVIPHLNGLVGDAASFGAVNTVLCKTKQGFNTDGQGFMLMLAAAKVPVKGVRALVLGAGGAGRSVAKKLSDGGAEVFIYNRSPAKAKKVAEDFRITALSELSNARYDIIVNATGVGMHESVGISPCGEELLSLCEAAVDLIYYPEESEFLRIARKFGKLTVNGAPMLFYQAYFAQCIYFGLKPDYVLAEKLYNQYRKGLI